jgi:hypothetical protein
VLRVRHLAATHLRRVGEDGSVSVPGFTAERALRRPHRYEATWRENGPDGVVPAIFGCGFLAQYCVESIKATEATAGKAAPSLLTCLAYYLECGGTPASLVPVIYGPPDTIWA